MSATAPGRNELCECGSGKKFKRCCGASAASSAQATQMARDAELSKAMALLQQGRVPQAKKMLASLVIAQPLDPEHHYLLGYAALQEGKHCEAANAMNRALDLGLTDPAAFYHYGCALAAMSQYAEAAAAFEQSLALKPDFLLARTNLANCYFELRDFSAAETQYRQTLAANPRNLAACHNLAQVFSLTQRNDQAIHYFCRAVQAAPQVAELRACLATMQEAENQLDSAEATARSALSDEPHNATAAIVFARVLRRRLEGRGALAALEAADLNASMPRTAIAYWFERGQVLELLGRYRDAFDAFVTCKTALAQARPRAYDGQATEQALLRERLVLTPERILSWALPPQSGRLMPVFIVGFPRSGTTLLEQMLGCHSSIVPCGELETSIEREAGRPDYPDRLVELTDTDREAMFMLWRTDYLEVLTRHAQHTPTARYATDKLPLNLMRIGLIRLLFRRFELFVLRGQRERRGFSDFTGTMFFLVQLLPQLLRLAFAADDH